MLASVIQHNVTRHDFWSMSFSEYVSLVKAINLSMSDNQNKPAPPTYDAHLKNKQAFERMEKARMKMIEEQANGSE